MRKYTRRIRAIRDLQKMVSSLLALEFQDIYSHEEVIFPHWENDVSKLWFTDFFFFFL